MYNYDTPDGLWRLGPSVEFYSDEAFCLQDESSALENYEDDVDFGSDELDERVRIAVDIALFDVREEWIESA